MTPFELSLQHDLDVERQRFDSDWLFKWHGMKYEGGKTDVEDFKGGRITYGGILFEGTARLVFWTAVGRYLEQQAHLAFQRWERETVGYPAAVRRASLEGTERVARTFAAGVMQRAIKTDQALRGRGTPKTDVPRESGMAHTKASAAIHRLTQAHIAMLPTAQADEPRSITKRFGEALNLRPSLFGVSIDLKKLFGWRK